MYAWDGIDEEYFTDKKKILSKEDVLIYTAAGEILLSRLHNTKRWFDKRNDTIDRPIKMIEWRFKSRKSLIEKCHNRGIRITDREKVKSEIRDIVGVRLICPYRHDVTNIADAIIGMQDLLLLEKKDYVTNPKPSGYSGIHLIMGVSVYTPVGLRQVPIEIQIRTIAMHEWCTMEHSMNYKYGLSDEDTQAWFKDQARLACERDEQYERQYQSMKAQSQA